MNEVEQSLWDLIDNEYLLSYAEWVTLLRSVAADLEQGLSKAEKEHCNGT